MAFCTMISTQEAARLTHRARRRPQEKIRLICGGTGSFGRSDAQCATLKEGARREVSGESRDWFRFQLTDGQSPDLPLSQGKGHVQRDGKNSSEVFLS